MPIQNSRRTFLRGGFLLSVAAWASACRTAPPPATPTIPPTEAPAPTSLPATPTAAPTSTPAPATTATPSAAQFSGERALAHAAAQMQWQPRDTGSEGWKKCGDYIADQLQQARWEVENQRFPYRDVECRNIIGKRGSGPRVIIGAHYDARRRSDQDKDPAKQSEVVPAANDGASGIAVLLELASVLRPEELGYEVWLAAFDAEDNGDIDGWEWVVGSKHLADSLTEAPAAVIVIDMIGDADQQIYFEGSSDPALREAIWGVAGDLAFASFVPQVRYSMLDDHTPFLQRGYRAIDMIDFDYPYWHTTQDTLDKVSAPSLAAVGKTLEEWLLRGGKGIQTADIARPAYQA